MIYGVGTDIVMIARIRHALERFGERFARRILSDTELTAFRRARAPEYFLAKSFAAKEAFSKAMGTGIRAPVTWRYIELGRDRRGKPLILPHPALAARMREWGVGEGHVSLADEVDAAVAFVVLERVQA